MSNHKILVIDDSKVIRMHVRDMLPEGNFELLEAKDGLEGYHLIRTETPNLIILDFLLPKMSGWEVFQQIQTEDNLKSIPLVLMSGRKEEVVEKIPEPFPHFAFIEKPFDQKQLVQAIKEAMAKAKQYSPKPTVFSPKLEELTGDYGTDIQTLQSQIAQMQTEMETMKKQMSQLVAFIKKKLP
ncbi:MAG: response regulator [Microcystis sp.]|uniref:Two-component response regulator n=1 Tax=Microcystis aeruginosa PCC 9443 TaxID=1160281 RepID=I4G7D3_MICAE|nr:response regulator [Microcystis aeruginosa]MBE9074339.1 response regulator [Microcystis sp. LEGE 08355]NCS27448.1 response regulator [Microcystis aeruginosa F13-15]CCI03844.1 Two-component response regulator [Microcystis aeruginosa PCC 9443]